MKNFLTKFIPIFFFSFLYHEIAIGQFQYISPVPGSSLNKPETNIIIRSALGFSETSNQLQKYFLVTGSLSGKHVVNVVVCEKGKEIILKPLEKFWFGETVFVKAGEGLRSADKKYILSAEFNFQIQPEYSADEKLQIQQAMKSVYAEDAPEYTSREKLGSNGLPDFTINTNTTPSAGDVFFSHFNIFNPLADTHYCIIKNNGDSVYGMHDQIVFNNFDLNDNGFLTLYDQVDSQFMMLDSNYYLIDSFQMGNGYKSDVHEFRIFPDGSHWMLCYDPQIIDMSVYNQSYNKKTTVIGCVIQKLDSNDNVVFQWRSWDHYSVLDPEHTDFSVGFIDAVHGNAIEIETDGNILLSARHMCEITKINTTTGDMIWRLGGKNNQFTFLNDTEAPEFHYQHDVRRIENGHITMFDNGNFHSPQVSFAKEYAIDETNKIATLTWSYKRTVGSGDVFSIAMGSTQRLPNGNTFICWGLNLAQDDNPSITEIDVNKNIVWEMTIANQDAVYRATKHEWNPCSRPTGSLLEVKNITNNSAKIDWDAATNAISYDVHYRKANKTTWKLKTTTNTSKKLKNLSADQKYVYQVRSKCADDVSSGWSPIDTFLTLPLKLELEESKPQYSVDVYPNPFSEKLNIKFNLTEKSDVLITILDLTGRVVKRELLSIENGIDDFEIEMQNLLPGTYFVELKSVDFEAVKKVVKR